jgi:hypothetical protein
MGCIYFGTYCGKTAEEFRMKKNKILIVFLIGLFLVTGLVMTGCGENCGCNSYYEVSTANGPERRYSDKCETIFCAKDMNKKNDCNCRMVR